MNLESSDVPLPDVQEPLRYEVRIHQTRPDNFQWSVKRITGYGLIGAGHGSKLTEERARVAAQQAVDQDARHQEWLSRRIDYTYEVTR